MRRGRKKYPRLARCPDFITQRQHLELTGRTKKFCKLDVIAVLSLDHDTDVNQTRCRAQTLFRRRAATPGRHGLVTGRICRGATCHTMCQGAGDDLGRFSCGARPSSLPLNFRVVSREPSLAKPMVKKIRPLVAAFCAGSYAKTVATGGEHVDLGWNVRLLPGTIYIQVRIYASANGIERII